MWIVQDWTGKQVFPDTFDTFDTFEDGWERIYRMVEQEIANGEIAADEEHAFDDFYVVEVSPS